MLQRAVPEVLKRAVPEASPERGELQAPLFGLGCWKRKSSVTYFLPKGS